MDWYVDAGETTSVSALRHEIVEHVRRHAAPDADLDGVGLAVSELLSNAIRHTDGPAWAHLDWSAERPVLEVHDLGPGFELAPALPDPRSEGDGGRGLFLVSNVAGWLDVAAKRAGGSKVRAELPAARTPQRDYDPPRRRITSLPAPDEARGDGSFGKESFLRALVVQLAEAVEAADGPAAAEAAIAQVGADVGGRMEEEYRKARGIVGELDPEQIGDLYVRLKAAIDGDFYVVEANEQRIVLGNRACPFGDAVKRAPGLCRMTSSVFGGIAARNSGGQGVSVLLEERIAVGDPECRVVVVLQGARAGSWDSAHNYEPVGQP